MKIKGNHVILSTEEWRLLQQYIGEIDTRDAGIMAYKKQIQENRRRSIREAISMGFTMTPTGFRFEMEGTL